MKGAVLSSVEVHNLSADTFQLFGGLTVNNLTATQIVALMPGVAFIGKTTLGADKLSVLRIDGEPFSVMATGTNGSYTPDIKNFEMIRLFGPRRKPKPRPVS